MPASDVVREPLVFRSLCSEFQVKLLLMRIIPGQDGVDLTPRPVWILFDDLFSAQALLMERDNLIDRHASTINAQSTTADATRSNEIRL
jgi:hypothetical protein